MIDQVFGHFIFVTFSPGIVLCKIRPPTSPPGSTDGGWTRIFFLFFWKLWKRENGQKRSVFITLWNYTKERYGRGRLGIALTNLVVQVGIHNQIKAGGRGTNSELVTLVAVVH